MDVADALARLDEVAVRRRVSSLDPATSEFGVDEENLHYMWHWFEQLAAFYKRAAAEGRAVVFKADRCEFSMEPRYRPGKK